MRRPVKAAVRKMVASSSDVTGGFYTLLTSFRGKPQTFFARWKIA
jgi:hypothetical protein